MLKRSLLPIVVAYIALVLIWGTTWLAIKIQLHSAPPLMSVGLRFVVAGAAVFLLGRLFRVSLGAWNTRLTLVMAACLFGFNYILNYIAEIQVSSGLTAVLFGTLPFFVFGFGRLFGKESATPAAIVGAVAAFIGVTVVSASQGLHGSVWYALAAVAAAAFAGFGMVFVKQYSQSETFSAMPRAMLVSGIIMTVVAALVEKVHLSNFLTASSGGALLYLSLVGTVAAFYLNFWLLQRIKASALSLFSLLTPVVALLVGAGLAHETVGAADALGVLLILAGCGVALFLNRAEPKARLLRAVACEEEPAS